MSITVHSQILFSKDVVKLPLKLSYVKAPLAAPAKILNICAIYIKRFYNLYKFSSNHQVHSKDIPINDSQLVLETWFTLMLFLKYKKQIFPYNYAIISCAKIYSGEKHWEHWKNLYFHCGGSDHMPACLPLKWAVQTTLHTQQDMPHLNKQTKH